MALGGGLISGGDLLGSSRFGRSLAPKNTRARTEPPSSIGVNMLCDFVCLRSGGEGGRKFVCSGCGDVRGMG